MPLIKLSPQNIKDIISLDASGVSHSEIARRFHVDRGTIITRLKSAGVKQHKRPKMKKNQKTIKAFRQKIVKNGDYKKVLANSMKREPIVDQYHRLVGYRDVEAPKKVQDVIRASVPWGGGLPHT